MGGWIASGEHPAPEAIDAFAAGTPTAEQAREVVAHLIHGCTACSERIARSAALIASPPEELPLEGRGYDFAITRALHAVENREEDLLRARLALSRSADRVEAPFGRQGARRDGERSPRPLAWAQCESLVEAARELRHEDPATMLRLASLAVAVAESLDLRECGPRNVRDLQARAWAELGNAQRVLGDLRRAEESLGRAFALATEGTSDALLFAGLVDLTASLLRAQRKFREAGALLDLACRIYFEYEDPHLAGRAMISKAMVLDYAGRSREASRLLHDGLCLIDGARDPQLLVAGLHHAISLAIDEGDFARASRLLAESRDLYEEHGEALELLRRRRLEGRAADGLGNPSEAERAFAESREGFIRYGLPYDVALASLDLAALWVRQGRTAKVRRLVDEMLTTFRAHGIRREAIATVLVLRRALERERASERLVRSAAARLRRVERWQPAPAVVLAFRPRRRR